MVEMSPQAIFSGQRQTGTSADILSVVGGVVVEVALLFGFGERGVRRKEKEGKGKGKETTNTKADAEPIDFFPFFFFL